MVKDGQQATDNDDVSFGTEEQGLPNGVKRKEDFFTLLGLAEGYQEKVDQHNDRMTLYGGATLVYVTMLLVFGLNFSPEFLKNTKFMIVSVLLLMTFMCVLFHLLRNILQKRRRDIRALKDLVVLLRESLAVLNDDDFTLLERAEVKIRMSRFGDDPVKDDQ